MIYDAQRKPSHDIFNSSIADLNLLAVDWLPVGLPKKWAAAALPDVTFYLQQRDIILMAHNIEEYSLLPTNSGGNRRFKT